MVPMRGQCRWSLPMKQRQLALNLAGDARASFVDKHIDLRAHAELREINARLDGEAGPGDVASLIAGFEVVHIGPVAVGFASDGMAGAMSEEGGKAFGGDETAHGVIHFKALHRPAGGQGLANETKAGIPSLSHDCEDLAPPR